MPTVDPMSFTCPLVRDFFLSFFLALLVRNLFLFFSSICAHIAGPSSTHYRTIFLDLPTCNIDYTELSGNPSHPVLFPFRLSRHTVSSLGLRSNRTPLYPRGMGYIRDVNRVVPPLRETSPTLSHGQLHYPGAHDVPPPGPP